MKRNNMDKSVFGGGLLVGGGILGTIGALLFAVWLFGTTTVNPGQRGVRVTLGKASDTVLSEGMYFTAPFITSVNKVSIRLQKTEATAEAATRDLQRVTAKFALNWNINPDNVVLMYNSIGDEDDVAERVIAPAVAEVLKAATSKLTAEEILSRRLDLKSDIDHQLKERLTRYNVLVSDISLVDLDFTDAFNHAVEEKQIMEQSAKKAEYSAQVAKQQAVSTVNAARGEAESRLINAKAEAESELIKAKAQAQGQKLLQQTLTKDVLTLEYLKKWNGNLPMVTTSSAGGIMMQLPTNPRENKISNEESED
jgi:regulator of protease activity HflC (stomatin/prohibitin superfamily)